MTNPTDQQASSNYAEKKAFFDNMLTIYGRKPVLEVLQNHPDTIYHLHLASSNKPDGIIRELTALAEQHNIDIRYHDKKALSRISRNSKQDQGVAADLQWQNYLNDERFLSEWRQQPYRLLAVDGITNPQNLGMIIRSVCAGNIDGLLLADQGNAQISPLVIKASVGTLFKTRIIRCQSLSESLEGFSQSGASIYSLCADAEQSLFELEPDAQSIFVLGNETEGVSKTVNTLANKQLSIPMNNGVESLNVAVAAALVAFQPGLQR